MSELSLRNRQRLQPLNLSLLRQFTEAAITDIFGDATYELGFHFVGPQEMARVNEQFLQHTGSTDVITFDHRESSVQPPHGEIFICVADAMKQAREFRTDWQNEVARYVIHGLLHLAGHDDLDPKARQVMKREENRHLRRLARRFPLSKLRRAPKLPKR